MEDKCFEAEARNDEAAFKKQVQAIENEIGEFKAHLESLIDASNKDKPLRNPA